MRGNGKHGFATGFQAFVFFFIWGNVTFGVENSMHVKDPQSNVLCSIFHGARSRFWVVRKCSLAASTAAIAAVAEEATAAAPAPAAAAESILEKTFFCLKRI